MDITPLRVSRDFRSLFIAHSVSFVGDEIIAVVVPYQVFKITGSTFAVGMLGLVTLVPVFVFPIIGGAAADAMERRGLIVTTYAILAALSLAMAWNAARPTPLLWPLYVFSFFSAGLYTFNRPALDTWPARLLEPDLLPSSNALEAGFGTAAMMVGPLTAGIMLATVGAATAYVVDAGTFLFAIAMIWRMRPSPPSDEENEISWEAIKDGFRFLRGKRNVQAVFLADLNAMTFGWPMALMPAVALTIGGAGHQEQVLGLLFAAPAVGSFLTTVFSGRAKDVRRQGRTILVANIVWGAAIALFGLVHTLWAALLLLAVASAGDMVSGIYRSSILQAAVEDRYRGRLGGIARAACATGPSRGEVESCVVASLAGVPAAIVSGGLATTAGVAAIRWYAPGLWRHDARHPTP
jgi:MFS family permease